jgi:hypothetical protein
MAGPKTIYVRDADEALWAEAEALAKEQHGSLAAFVAKAIRRELERSRSTRPATDEVVVVICGSDGVPRKQKFRGKWLVEPMSVGDRNELRQGVARTARGRYAVFTEDDRSGEADLKDWDSLEEIPDGALEVDVRVALAEARGEEYIEFRDI